MACCILLGNKYNEHNTINFYKYKLELCKQEIFTILLSDLESTLVSKCCKFDCFSKLISGSATRESKFDVST